MSQVNHFTHKSGYDVIRSQLVWLFKSAQPKAAHHPPGAYFTTYAETERNLAKKIFVPVVKLAYIFSFTPSTTPALLPLPGGRGRLGRVFYSPSDYHVEKTLQVNCRATGL